MLQSSGEFKRAAEDYISKTDVLSRDFGVQTKLNTNKLVSSLEESGYKYQTDLAKTKADLGTIDKDILAQETGAATAGISTAFAESQKGLEASMARRGLTGSGLDAQAMGSLAGQEAMAKYSATSQARQQARGISDQIRMQQMGISGQQYQAGTQTAQGIYSAQTQGMGTAYQTGINQAGQALQAGITGTQQGLQTLGQVQSIGQQQYGLGAGMLGSAAGGFQQVGAGYGGIYGSQVQQSSGMFNAQTQAAASHNQGIGSIVGTAAGIGVGVAMSDERLKDNIQKVGEVSGLNVYVWDWNEQAIELGINTPTIGFIAQEAIDIYPEHVYETDTGYLSIDYNSIIGGE
jgi:hypothetical protein